MADEIKEEPKVEEVMTEKEKFEEVVPEEQSGAQEESTPDIVEIPTLELEEYAIPEAEETAVKDTTKGSTKFAWIGSGQCGGRIVRAFYDLGYKKTIAVNTTKQDLELLNIPEEQKFLMDIGSAGAGKDMNRGKDAAVQYRQEIFDLARKVFGQTNVDHIMIAVGAGGGTGSGSAIPLVEIARRYVKYIGIGDPKKKVGVIMTLPTDGEASSPTVAENAWKTAMALSELAEKGEISPLIIIDNNKIKKLYAGLTVKDFWPKINNTVAGLFNIFNTLSSLSSQYTTFDATDYRSIIECGGCSIMGLTSVAKFDTEQSISSAVKDNLTKTLLAEGFDLPSATVLGSIAVGGKTIMESVAGLQDNLNYGFDILTNLCGNATVHRGIYEDNKNTLRVYTIIGGLDRPTARIDRLTENFTVEDENPTKEEKTEE